MSIAQITDKIVAQKFYNFTPSTISCTSTDPQITSTHIQFANHNAVPSVPLDELDGFERLVHVSDSQVVAEVHHRLPHELVCALEADKVAHEPSRHHCMLVYVRHE